MNNSTARRLVILCFAISVSASAENIDENARPILEASEKPFMEFVQRTVSVPPLQLPSPNQPKAGRELSDISALLWKQLSFVDVPITPENKMERLETFNAMCVLHKWLTRRESYTNLVLSSYIQNVISASLLGAMADGNVTVDETQLINTLFEQAPQAEVILLTVERSAPNSQAMREYREYMRKPQPEIRRPSIAAVGLALLDELHEQPTLEPRILLHQERSASLLCYAAGAGFNVVCAKRLIEYARMGGNLKLPREGMVKDMTLRVPKINDVAIPGYAISVESLAIMMTGVREARSKH